MKIVKPKYLMLNGKNAFPNVTYENFLIDIINCSNFFSHKHSYMEQFVLTTEQSHGEDDAYTSDYQLDFKLIVGSDIMRIRNKNMPEFDYSRMEEGFIFTKTKNDMEEESEDTVLLDLSQVKIENLRNGRYANNTIKSIVKNIKKSKNIFMYYPYEFVVQNSMEYKILVSEVLKAFITLLTYRDEMKLGKDTFLCIKVNRYFEIFEWIIKKFVHRDSVPEYMSANYRDLKAYSVF